MVFVAQFVIPFSLHAPVPYYTRGLPTQWESDPMDESADYLLGNRSASLSFVYLVVHFADFYRILIVAVNGIERPKETRATGSTGKQLR